MTDPTEPATPISGVATPLNARERLALDYYAMERVSPRDSEKIHHPSNRGWSSGTIDSLLDKGLLEVGPGGWHVLSERGRAARGK